MTEPTDIVVPYDSHAEAAVIGCRILGRQCEPLSKDLFFRKDCRCLNHVLNKLQQAGELTDVAGENTVRVYRYLMRHDWMQHVGTKRDLVTMMEAVTHLDFIEDYIERLKQMRFRRLVLEHAGELIRLASNQFGNIEELRTAVSKGVRNER